MRDVWSEKSKSSAKKEATSRNGRAREEARKELRVNVNVARYLIYMLERAVQCCMIYSLSLSLSLSLCLSLDLDLDLDLVYVRDLPRTRTQGDPHE